MSNARGDKKRKSFCFFPGSMPPLKRGAKPTGIGDLPIPVEARPIWTDTEEQSQHQRDVPRECVGVNRVRWMEGDTMGNPSPLRRSRSSSAEERKKSLKKQKLNGVFLSSVLLVGSPEGSCCKATSSREKTTPVLDRRGKNGEEIVRNSQLFHQNKTHMYEELLLHRWR